MFLKDYPGFCVDNELRQRIRRKDRIEEFILTAWEGNEEIGKSSPIFWYIFEVKPADDLLMARR